MRELYIDFTSPDPKHKKYPVVSWIIRKVQGTKYSHVRARWVNSTGRTLVYEASGRHVRFVGTIAQEQNPVIIQKSYKLNLSRDEYRKLIDVCMKYAHVDYGMWQLIGIGVAKVFRLKKNPFAAGRKSQVCSELIGAILEEVKGWDVPQDLDLAGPLEIEHLLESMAKTKGDLTLD